jgi:hypothetical protein
MKFLCAAPIYANNVSWMNFMKQVLEWTYLVILVRREHLVHTLLPKEVVLQLISILASPCSWSCVHPF